MCCGSADTEFRMKKETRHYVVQGLLCIYATSAPKGQTSAGLLPVQVYGQDFRGT